MIKIYAIKDEVAGSFSFLMLHKNDEMCKRLISGHFSLPNPTPVNTFYDNKNCYIIGELNEESGQINAMPTPVFAFSLKEVRDDLLLKLSTEEAFLKHQLEILEKQKEITKNAGEKQLSSKAKA